MPDLSPVVIEPDLSARLGLIVIRWSGIEGWLAHLLAALVGADPGALSAVTNTAGSASLIQWCLTLITVHEHKQTELTELAALLRRANDLRMDRNALVHGLWDPDGCEAGTCVVNTYNWKRSEIIRGELVTAAELDDLLDDLNEWVSDYIRLGKQLGFPRKRGESKSIFLD